MGGRGREKEERKWETEGDRKREMDRERARDSVQNRMSFLLSSMF